MYSFKNDYSEGAHPRILNALMESNLEQVAGYGEDGFTLKAIELLKARIGRSDADIHLFSGGTQTNLTALSAFLRPHEAVIATGVYLEFHRNRFTLYQARFGSAESVLQKE